jgi:hypothetical protein
MSFDDIFHPSRKPCSQVLIKAQEVGEGVKQANILLGGESLAPGVSVIEASYGAGFFRDPSESR